jgi:hypothetical protein
MPERWVLSEPERVSEASFMDAERFDAFVRSLKGGASRRGVIRGFAALMLGSLAVVQPDGTLGKNGKKGKNKKRKPPFNAFGCLDVGVTCKNGGQCCSGICTGKKRKKGKKRRKRCEGHDATNCPGGQIEASCGGISRPCATAAGTQGVCNTTTGNAAFCGAGGNCFPCHRDADCVEACGEGAACILCPGKCDEVGGTACSGRGFQICGFQ